MKIRAIAVAVLSLACLIVALDEVRAAYFQQSGDDELAKFIVDIVRQNSDFSGGTSNVVSGFVCSRVSRDTLDQLVSAPGSLSIRTIDEQSPSGGQRHGYYVTPRVSIFEGLAKWLSRPRLQIELSDSGDCFSSVRSGGFI